GDDLAAWQHRLERQHVVDGHAVQERVRPARVLAHVAPQGADALAGGIGHVVETIGTGRGAQVQVDHARLDDGAAVVRIDGEDAVHAREGQHHAAVTGYRAAAQPGAGATGRAGHAAFVTQPHDRADVRGATRQPDGLRARPRPRR